MQVNSYLELNKMFNYFGIDQNHDSQDLRIVMIFSEPGFLRNLLDGQDFCLNCFLNLLNGRGLNSQGYFDYHPGNP